MFRTAIRSAGSPPNLETQKGHLSFEVAFLLASHISPGANRDSLCDLRVLQCPGLVARNKRLILPRAGGTTSVHAVLDARTGRHMEGLAGRGELTHT
jgi:hypothetical protein